MRNLFLTHCGPRLGGRNVGAVSNAEDVLERVVLQCFFVHVQIASWVGQLATTFSSRSLAEQKVRNTHRRRYVEQIIGDN